MAHRPGIFASTVPDRAEASWPIIWRSLLGLIPLAGDWNPSGLPGAPIRISFDAVAWVTREKLSNFFRPTNRRAVEEMGQTTPFSVQIDHIGTTDIVTVRGEIDIVSAPEFEEKLSTVGSTIVVDLRHLDFMDSSGLAVLLRRQAMLDESSELRLVVKPGIIERLFEVSGIDKVFPIYSEVEAAIDGTNSESSSSQRG